MSGFLNEFLSSQFAVPILDGLVSALILKFAMSYTDNYELLKIGGVVAIVTWITNMIAMNYVQPKA